MIISGRTHQVYILYLFFVWYCNRLNIGIAAMLAIIYCEPVIFCAMNCKMIFVLFMICFVSCELSKTEDRTDFKIEYEKYELANGLDVIFHIDRSDPVVAVVMSFHVGSAREKKDRTGFAHLFEHLLFSESENLGKGGMDKLSARIGGSGASGFTTSDITNYFQLVPNNALEKMIWAEADRLGWFINTVTEPVLAKEKQVIKNEKRQIVDNRPYGHTSYIIDKNLYAESHPYNWQPIGSFQDIQSATLSDVKEFYRDWYVPSNASLVIAGDFDKEKARAWVKKYFDEIPPGKAVVALTKQAGDIAQNIKLYHEDNFARLPELTITWPTVELYHPDSYPLRILTNYLSQGKAAPLYKMLVEGEQLSSNISMYNYASELAGQIQLSVRAFPDKNLNDVFEAIKESFAQFETQGISEKDLNRIKAGEEARLYSGLSKVMGKALRLAKDNVIADNPGFVNQDISRIMSVRPADVMRVYYKYIKDKNYIATSFLPKGKLEAVLEGSKKAEIEEENILSDVLEVSDTSVKVKYEPTPSIIDRSLEPSYGEKSELNIPDVWEHRLANGLSVYGIRNGEVPLVTFNLVIDGGQMVESFDKIGITNLLANMMTKGTERKTAADLEQAIQQLGASIDIYANKEGLVIAGETLSKNYNQTIDLLREILLEPRWDEHELVLARQKVKSQIRQQEANPKTIAQSNFNHLIYGNNHIKSRNILGNTESVNSIGMDDLKAYYTSYISPSVARMHVVGAIDQARVIKSLKTINDLWEGEEFVIPVYPTPEAPNNSQVYFYDVPNAKQSHLYIGYPALAVTDKDYFEASIMNYILGGGGFASKLTQVLREGKGYTYRIRSGFSGSKSIGPFTISSSVQSRVTLEALQLIKEILEEYDVNYTENDLGVTKAFMIKSNARAFETAHAKLSMLGHISKYDWQHDYVKNQEKIVNAMTTDRIRSLSQKYLNTNRMIWLVVGDAETQMERLKELGFGSPILINGY